MSEKQWPSDDVLEEVAVRAIDGAWSIEHDCQSNIEDLEGKL